METYKSEEIFLLKLGEIVLKGLNRRRFEDKLTANVSRRLHRYGRFRVYSRQSTVYVEPLEESCDLETPGWLSRPFLASWV